MMRILRALILGSAVGFASTSYAIFDAQVLAGMRSGTVKADTDGAEEEEFNSTEIGFAAHIDPIPLVPVAFGVYANTSTFSDLDEEGTGFSKGAGLEVGVQLYAWLPIGIAGLKPYAKLGLPLYSAYKMDSIATVGTTETEYPAVLETSGMHFGFGLGWSPIPLVPVAVLLELDIGSQTMKYTEAKIGSTDLTDSMPKLDYSSKAFLIGVQAGL